MLSPVDSEDTQAKGPSHLILQEKTYRDGGSML